jgi:hypothetical protein
MGRPTGVRLPEGVLLAGDSANVGRPKVTGFCNLTGTGPRTAPEKEIEEGNLDAVFVADHIDQLADHRGGVRGGVEPRAAGKQGERFSVVENQTGLLVALGVDAKLVWHGKNPSGSGHPLPQDRSGLIFAYWTLAPTRAPNGLLPG